MGTGSTRRRQLARSNQTQRSGDWGTYYGGMATVDNPTPAGTVGKDTRWLSTPDGRTVQWGAPLYTDPAGGYRDASGRQLGYFKSAEQDSIDRLAAADAKQKAYIDAHSPQGGLFRTGPQDTSPGSFNEALRQAALQRWLDAVKASKKPKPMSQEDTLNAGFEKNYYDPSNDIRKSYAAQEAAINAQYDAMLSRVGNEHAAAEKGVRAEGQALQKSLTAIGADATANLAASNRQIDQEYAKALRGVNDDYKTAAKATKAQGGSTAGLAAAGAASKADLREGHVADAALGQRYQSMLAQEINNRQATGATVTTANVQDLARILQTVRDNTSADRLSAVAKIEANMAGDLAQAKSQKAAAKYSLFLSTLKSGGTLGQAALKVASPGTINSAIDTLKSGNIDFSKSFSGLSKSKDPNEIKLGQQYEEALLNHSKTPQQVWAEWQANPDRASMPLLGDSIMQLVGYAQALSVDPKTLRKYLAERGLK